MVSAELYRAFFEALAVRLHHRHAFESHDARVEPALALQAREVALDLLGVGFFGRSSPATVARARAMVVAAQAPGYGAQRWLDRVPDAARTTSAEIAGASSISQRR